MPRKADFNRDTALKQAMELFWTRGFAGTSLKDIEAALDMRPGSIYAAFGSKEALFRSALTRYAEASRASLKETLARADSPLAGLADHVRALGHSMQEDAPSRACMLTKTVLELPQSDASLRVAAEEMLRETEAAFEAVFRHAQALGELPEGKDPSLLAARLQSQIMGLRSYAQRSDGPARAEHLAEEIAQDIEALTA